MATQKKTAEVDYSMQEKILALYELQKIDSKIDEINKVKGELPLEVQDLEDEMAGMKTRIEHINAEIEELNTLTKQRKREVDQAKIMIGNYKEQQNNVRNNREFAFLEKEKEYETLEIELSEKKIREQNELVERKTREIEEAREQIVDHEHNLAEKKAELESIVNETQAREEEIMTQAKELEKVIDDYTLKAFYRIRQNARNGLGIVTVQRSACGGCFNRIPPQRQLEIKMHKRIVVCEYCGRIMIDGLLAGIEEPEAAPAPAKRKTTRKKAASKTEE